MEMNFREYAEAWGSLAGAAGGAMLGGWPGAVVGGALGYGAEKLYDRWKNPQYQSKVDPKYFVYYRDMPDQQYPQGKIVKELLPQRDKYIDIGKDNELKNADANHPYYYFGKEVQTPTGVQVKVIPRIKAGYQHHQRATRQSGGYGQQYGGYGQQRQYGQQYGYGQQQRRRKPY